MYDNIYNTIKYPFIIIINKINRNNRIMDDLNGIEMTEIKSNNNIKK